ncbi:LysR family transcriptional regulator [Lactiplantibacillus carotarum]|uniref:LysR family transcriptional regulator n=1 Tax=Lactiplantibacillus carotarum TaxID=2993456 RepID=UPI00298ED28F|nr:LysR family transcriptional regulator [Lactiplantibacillus carotarum]
MNIRDLQYYVSLTQLKSFSAVATNFNVSQPTISAAVRRLESELGTQLLIRTNPHVPLELTATGEQTRLHSVAILAEYQLMQREIAHTENGQLSIGMPPIVEISYFPKIARQLPTSLFKQIKPVAQGSLAALADLKSGQLDLAVLAYLDDFDDPTVHLTTFDCQPFGIVLPRDHPLAIQDALPFTSLKGTPVVSLKNNFVHRQAFQRLARANRIRPTIVFESNEIPSVLNMVAAHVGVALMSRAVELPPGLCWRPLSDVNAPSFQVGLATRRSSHFSRTQTALLTAIQQAFLSL